MDHIVSVPDKSDLQPLQLSLVFQERKTVGQHLTGMEEVREAVDQGDRCVTGHLLKGLLGKSTYDDEIHPATETAGAIRRALSHPKIDLSRPEKNRMTPELGHPGLKGSSCP